MGTHNTHIKEKSRTITLAEVKQYGYLIANGNVYDISEYKNHPGGPDALTKAKGTDATCHYLYHGKKGKKEWEKYRIGKLGTTNTNTS